MFLPCCGAVPCFRRIRWRSISSAGFDPISQRALTRYYIDAGAGGLAVGVHATQFKIREAHPLPAGPGTGRRDGPGLDAAAATDDRRGDRQHRRGTGGGAAARALGYHAVLLGLAAWPGPARMS